MLARWEEVQALWINLEPLFSGRDVYKQLPGRFARRGSASDLMSLCVWAGQRGGEGGAFGIEGLPGGFRKQDSDIRPGSDRSTVLSRWGSC